MPTTSTSFVGVAADRTDFGATVTDRHGDHAGCTAGHFVDRQLDFGVAATQCDFQTVSDPEGLGRTGTHDRSVVPNQLGQRLRQFLQPAVVGKATVVNAVGRHKDDFDVVLIEFVGRDRYGRFRWSTVPWHLRWASVSRRRFDVVGITIVQELSPFAFAQ